MHDHVVRRFAAACGTGNVAALKAVLAADVVAVCDGGGKVRAPTRPLRGADEVARFVATLLTGCVPAVESVNGRAGLTLRRAGRAVAVLAVGVAGVEVTAVWIVLNPDKLRRR
jgi:RNA polymerase sigma-70 factor, ECF subfamily